MRRDHGRPFSTTMAKMGGIFTTFNQLDTNKKESRDIPTSQDGSIVRKMKS